METHDVNIAELAPAWATVPKDITAAILTASPAGPPQSWTVRAPGEAPPAAEYVNCSSAFLARLYLRLTVYGRWAELAVVMPEEDWALYAGVRLLSTLQADIRAGRSWSVRFSGRFGRAEYEVVFSPPGPPRPAVVVLEPVLDLATRFDLTIGPSHRDGEVLISLHDVPTGKAPMATLEIEPRETLSERVLEVLRGWAATYLR